MPRSRILNFNFWSNEEIAKLDPHARLLFQGLWGLADRDGRLEDRPPRIHARIFPYESRLDVRTLLDMLQQAGLIVRYSVDSVGLIQVVNFLKYQNPHPNEPSFDLPAPPGYQSGESERPARLQKVRRRRALNAEYAKRYRERRDAATRELPVMLRHDRVMSASCADRHDGRTDSENRSRAGNRRDVESTSYGAAGTPRHENHDNHDETGPARELSVMMRHDRRHETVMSISHDNHDDRHGSTDVLNVGDRRTSAIPGQESRNVISGHDNFALHALTLNQYSSSRSKDLSHTQREARNPAPAGAVCVMGNGTEPAERKPETERSKSGGPVSGSVYTLAECRRYAESLDGIDTPPAFAKTIWRTGTDDEQIAAFLERGGRKETDHERYERIFREADQRRRDN